jgi:hypothetical protein
MYLGYFINEETMNTRKRYITTSHFVPTYSRTFLDFRFLQKLLHINKEINLYKDVNLYIDKLKEEE